MQSTTEMLTISQASKFLGLTANTLTYLINQKKLSGIKRGPGIRRSILISKNALIRFRDNNKVLLDYYHLGAPEGYLSLRMIATRFNIKISLAGLWIKQGRFKDVEKITGLPCGNLTIVPLHSIIEYENIVKQLKDSYLEVEEAQKMLGITKSLILRWLRQKKIQKVITWYGVRYISLDELNWLQNELEREREMIPLLEAVKMLELPYEIVSDISSKYRIPSMIGKVHLLSKSDFEKMKIEHADLITYHKSGIPKDFFNTKMLAERFKVPQMEIARWIRQERFRGVQKIGALTTTSSFFIIPESSVYEYENFVNNLNENFINCEEAMKELNISSSTMHNWISQNKIPGSILWLKKWYIQKSSIKTIVAEMDRQKNSINISQACHEFQISRNQVTTLINNGEVPFTTMKGNIKLINRDDLSTALEKKSNETNHCTSKTTKNPKKKPPRIPEGFLSIHNFSRLVNASSNTIKQLIQHGEIKDLKRHTVDGHDYILIPEFAVEEYFKKNDSIEKVYTTAQAAEFLKKNIIIPWLDSLKKGISQMYSLRIGNI
ncbi:helix-turn-helix domain-containing protein [Paenibacillus chitinolyticus]|uniref:helix-turn-helix domain-containing protein n=1 Tax=Paenibacillus chitinolyticus TaxID=79263 RepID=UPI003669FE72